MTFANAPDGKPFLGLPSRDVRNVHLRMDCFSDTNISVMSIIQRAIQVTLCLLNGFFVSFGVDRRVFYTSCLVPPPL